MTDAPSKAIIAAWARLVRAEQKLLRAIEGDLKRQGLPALAWYDVLLELTRNDKTRLRPADLERETLLAQYNLSRLLDRLEREGLIRREAYDEDGRGQWIVATAKGRALQRKMWPAYAASIARYIGARLTESEAEALGKLLGKLLTPVS